MIKARHREMNLFKTMLLVIIKWLRNSSSLAAEPVLLTPLISQSGKCPRWK